jgi:hypothetical protein
MDLLSNKPLITSSSTFLVCNPVSLVVRENWTGLAYIQSHKTKDLAAQLTGLILEDKRWLFYILDNNVYWGFYFILLFSFSQ